MSRELPALQDLRIYSSVTIVADYVHREDAFVYVLYQVFWAYVLIESDYVD